MALCPWTGYRIGRGMEKNMNKRVFQRDIQLFWTLEGKTFPISDLVTISEMSTEFRNGKSYITLRCSSAAKNFIINFQRGTIEARYNVVPEDSPWAGESFCTISDMKPSSSRIKPLTSWDANKNDEIEFVIGVNCHIAWRYLAKEIQEHFEWQEERRKNEDD